MPEPVVTAAVVPEPVATASVVTASVVPGPVATTPVAHSHPTSRVRRAQWLTVGLVAVLLLVSFSVAWRHTRIGAQLDPRLASPLIHGLPWELRRLLSSLARSWLLVGLAVAVAVLWLSATAQRRFDASVAALLVPASSLTALRQIRTGWLGLGEAHFPSGHATVAAALLVSVALLWPSSWWSDRAGPPAPHRRSDRAGPPAPPRWRDHAVPPAPPRWPTARRSWHSALRCWPTALWVLVLLVVAVGNVTLHAHQPGEVIAALLLVTGVTGLLLGILDPRPVRTVWRPNRGTMGPP